MRSAEVVFDQPFGQIVIKSVHVEGHMPEVDELFLDRPIKSFIDGVVLWRLHSGVVLLDVEGSALLRKGSLEFTAVIMANVLNLPCS